jgi:hypothetical protein
MDELDGEIKRLVDRRRARVAVEVTCDLGKSMHSGVVAVRPFRLHRDE